MTYNEARVFRRSAAVRSRRGSPGPFGRSPYTLGLRAYNYCDYYDYYPSGGHIININIIILTTTANVSCHNTRTGIYNIADGFCDLDRPNLETSRFPPARLFDSTPPPRHPLGLYWYVWIWIIRVRVTRPVKTGAYPIGSCFRKSLFVQTDFRTRINRGY